MTENGMLNRLVDDPSLFTGGRLTEPAVTKLGGGPRLLSVGDVDEVLSSGSLVHPLVTMSKSGARLPPERYTWGAVAAEPGRRNAVRHDLAAREVADGATVILESLNRTHRGVSAFCRALAKEIGVFVSASAYLTPASAQGFTHHFDTTDAFIVQTSGSKRWELIAPVLPQPLEQHTFRGVGAYEGLEQRIRQAPDLVFDLHEGDVLFLPRGWIHNCYSTGEPSLHVTFVIYAKSEYWVLRRLLDSALASAWARAYVRSPGAGIPLAEDEITRIVDNFADWARSHRTQLADTVGWGFLEGFSEPEIAVATALSLPVTAADTLVPLAENVVCFVEAGDGTGVVLSANDVVRLPSEAAERFRSAVADSRPLKVSELVEILGSEEGIAVANEMVRRGLARIEKDR